MLIYKDIFTHQYVFSDAYKFELVDDLYYVVKGKFIIDDCSISDDLIGGNKSEEAGEEDVEDAKKLVADIIHSGNLELAPSIVKKSEYKDAIRNYSQKLHKHVSSENEERGKFLKEKLNGFVKLLLEKYKTMTIYATEGDGFDLEGGLIHFEQEGEEGTEKEDTKCSIIVFKDSVYGEKY